MLKRIWAAYTDFITLDWLLRRLGNDQSRLLGVLLLAFAVFVLWQGVLGVQTGEMVRSFNRYGGIHDSIVTAESRVGWACFAAFLGLIGVCCSLPKRGGLPVLPISRFDLAFLRHPRPLLTLVAGYVTTHDVWARFHCVPNHRAFAAGSRNPFPWYFTKESLVEARGIASVCKFLLRCEYISDSDQFELGDHWQHPNRFEASRRGDCEDHALWAWRKLCESGVDAEFCVGRRTGSKPGSAAGHAWVVLRDNDGDRLLESVSKSKDRILRPLADVRDDYIPYFSVDREFRQWMYSGYLARFTKRHGHAPNQSETRDT